MKFLLLVLFMVASVNGFADDKCSKKEAMDSVQKACDLINTKGKAALDEIMTYRYCGANYVWIQDTDLAQPGDKTPIKMVLHPIQRRLNGTDLTQYKDKNGTKLFVEFDIMAKKEKDGGWVNYLWKKAGASDETPKTSFVKLCGDKFPWIAGSGIWVADIKE